MKLWPRLKNWLPAIFWACVISSFSTDTFSSEHTSVFIIPVLHWMFPHASAGTLELMHAFIRKTAHLTEYFMLGIFLMNGLMHGLRGQDRSWRLQWAIWAVAIAAGYAALDEFHQSFLPSRGSSAWDVLLDTTGAAVAQIVLWLRQLSRMRE
jgi:VanZ family protein